VTTVDRHALIMRNNQGGPEMTTPASEPVRTITTHGHQSLLTGRTVNIDDVRFRMLEPSEIKQAMAFPADYVMTGNRREQVKLSGNAVTPPAARDLIATVVAAITGEQVAA
jgi:DNA (cytosine-5)-methyltransferase 1